MYVLEGELAIFLDGNWNRARAGTAMLLPRGVEHSFAVITAPARVLTILAPAGYEDWYREHPNGALGHGAGKSTVERFVAVAARYGCEVTGPHPGRPPSESAGANVTPRCAAIVPGP